MASAKKKDTPVPTNREVYWEPSLDTIYGHMRSKYSFRVGQPPEEPKRINLEMTFDHAYLLQRWIEEK